MFDFNLGIFGWTLINFFIVLSLIYKFALPSLFEIVEAEDKQREALLKELNDNTAESKRIMQEYQAKLANVHDEVKKILEDAKREREEIKKLEVEKLIAEKQHVLEGIKQDGAYERKKMMDEVYNNTSEIITLAMKKLVGKDFSVTDHEALIQRNIDEIGVLARS
jgi:F-type H+-transporting ATPase subunit b